MIIKKYIICMAAVLFAVSALAGCTPKESMVLNPKAPVVVVLWHSYNTSVKSVLDEKIMEFNETVGRETGIVVDAYAYASRTELDEALYNSVNHMIGSEPIPDIFAVYPDSAYRLDEGGLLVELDTYFSKEDLEKYRPEFLKEGIWGEQASPKMIPVAKSTELLYLNTTDFRRFSTETGATEDMLHTWEGLSDTAKLYYEWSGGKSFLGFNGYGDFAIISAAQLGVDIYKEKGNEIQFNYPAETAKRVWHAYYVPHIKGWYNSETYNQDGVKSGKLIAYIGSSAGVSYFPSEVIIDNDTVYPVECEALPYPAFEGGENYMTQRGANMGIFKSDYAHEYASAEFLKWFTDPQQNMDFTVSTGYIPVEKEALASVPQLLEYAQGSNNDDMVRKSVAATLGAMNNDVFYSKKTFENSFKADGIFSESLARKTALDLDEIEVRTKNGEVREDIISELLQEENFLEWYDALATELSGELNGEEDKK